MYKKIIPKIKKKNMNTSSLQYSTISSRSFTSVNDLYSPYSIRDIFHFNPTKGKNITVYQATCPTTQRHSSNNESIILNTAALITSENYHSLNRIGSDGSVIRSTSTIFYDLDTIAKRHSYHCATELPVSNSELLKCKGKNHNKNGFIAKSEAIVQECAAQVKPKLKTQDSLKIAAKKLKKTQLNEVMLSSEIFLRDNNYTHPKCNSIVQETDDRQQKFWSYAKYRTEYTNPLADEKKHRRKDRGKRTEDPCPCQLFSYACPCTDKKSLTELAKNSKSLTVTDQITSTTKIFSNEGSEPSPKHCKTKKAKGFYYIQDTTQLEEKSANSNVVHKNHDMAPVLEEPPNNVLDRNNNQNIPENNSYAKTSLKSECKSRKKSKQIVCPNCREKLEILSTTEDEEIVKLKTSPIRDTDCSSSPTDTIYKNNDETDVCSHDPPCELLPVCQILPKDGNNVYMNPKCVRRISLTKQAPKTIRITKACRHHPPCIVVPSCQKLNVLKNNCEYIPPCLHRPRCINIPLCVPITKSLNYEEFINKQIDETDNAECSHYPPCNYTSAYQQSSPNNSADQHFHFSKNACEYVSEYTPRFILNSKLPCVTPMYSPCQIPLQMPCKCCKSNKSCQYDCIDCKCTPCDKIKECSSIGAVVYIRDVGCQFRSRSLPPRDSLLQSKDSSASFDLTGAKIGSYYNAFQALGYEDKFTNPIPGGEQSLSTLTTSSLEIDEECPSHGKKGNKKQTGFSPQPTVSPLVAAFTSYADPILQYCLPISKDLGRETNELQIGDNQINLKTNPLKPRKSFIKGKHKKVFSIKRRKNSRRNNTMSSRRIPYNPRIN